MIFRHRICRLFCIIFFAVFASSAFLKAEPLPPRSSTENDLDDPVLPLKPMSRLSEADEDRLQALALFAEGRTI